MSAINSTGTTPSTLYPSVTFANVKNDLESIDISVPETFKIYIVDPINISFDYFRKAFYAENSDILKYFKPGAGNTTIQDLKDIAILKNLLFLNSGGGTYTDSNNVETPLVKKTITFNGGDQEEFVINSFIITDIETAANNPYESWSVDSQIDLARKLSSYNYIYDFPIYLTGSTINTNALTWSQLKRTVNVFIYKFYSENNPGDNLSNGDPVPVILNFVVSFKTLIGLGTDNTEETNTQVLYQYKVEDWPFETIETN